MCSGLEFILFMVVSLMIGGAMGIVIIAMLTSSKNREASYNRMEEQKWNVKK